MANGNQNILGSLARTESGGSFQASNQEVGAGGMRGHFGRLQFGRARLQDAERAGVLPSGTTPEMFMANPALQRQVETWHLNDMRQQAERMGLDKYIGQNVGGVPITMDSILAMGHLGGIDGARRYLQSGGQYNPADVYGTSLSDYALTHGGAQQGAALNSRGAPQMAMQPTQPQGILAQLGIQRQDPTAQGETALPFYQRSRFGNFMGNLAMAFNSLQQRPDPNVPRVVMANREMREQDAANNRTIEWLSSQPGGEQFVGLVDAVGAAGALQAYRESRTRGGYRVVRGSELGLTGPAADRLFNVGPDGKTTAIGGGDINLGPPVSPLTSQFMQSTGVEMAKETGDAVAQGALAQRNLGQIDVLEGALLAEDAPEGMEAALKAFAGGYGIETEGLAGLQLAEAIISQLVPGQRPEGSGQMSDADLLLFKKSLPQLIYTREGNQQIINTMRAMADYDVERGRIARKLQLGQLTFDEAFAAYEALGNPLQLYRDRAAAEAAAGVAASGGASIDVPPLPQSAIDEGVTPEEWPSMWSAMTEEQRSAFQ